MFARQDREVFSVSEDDEWETAERLWPESTKFLRTIPKVIRDSLTEAAHCCDCGTFTASVAMAGRALEGLVRHFTTPQMYLGPGVLELHRQGIIDSRLLEWAKALHLDRNEAAHSSGQIFCQEDADDLLAFAAAICEYVFVFAARFQEFQKRKRESHDDSCPGFVVSSILVALSCPSPRSFRQ
jgi:hypothetical protein